MLIQPEGETGRALKRKACSLQQLMKISGPSSDPVQRGNEFRSSVRVWAVEEEVESYECLLRVDYKLQRRLFSTFLIYKLQGF